MARNLSKTTLWLIVITLLAEFSKSNSQPVLTKDDLVGVLRLVSTAEVNYFHTNGRYATFPELVKSGQLQQTAMRSPEHLPALRTLNLKSESEPLAGYVLGLVAPADGASYKMSLTQLGDKCGMSLFTDDGGALYEGKTIDCTATAAPAAQPRDWAPPDIDLVVPPAQKDVPCPLPKLLQEASSRVQELGDNLQQFSAKERIEHVEIGKNGKPHSSAAGVVNYVAEIRHDDAEHTFVQEYRSGESAGQLSTAKLADTGTAAFALIFHPRHIDEFAVECEGMTDLNARPVWQVHFAQRPDRINDFHSFRVGNVTYRVKLKGRAWIAADNYEVVRLETDLIEPIKPIDLQVEHMIIDYAPVEFRKRNLQLWLPESSSLFVDYHGHRYERRHNFSDFQLFWVETEQKVKAPHPGQGLAPQTN